MLDVAVYVSFEKDISHSLLSLAMDKYQGWLGTLALVRQPVSEKEKNEFKTQGA